MTSLILSSKKFDQLLQYRSLLSQFLPAKQIWKIGWDIGVLTLYDNRTVSNLDAGKWKWRKQL